MNWNHLKNKIYAWDGGWLDIYIHHTTSSDWEKWIRHVNQHYEIDWYNGRAEKDESKIDFTVIQEYWAGNSELISTARIFIGPIQLNAHFFEEGTIENDIDPREFKSIDDHHMLIRYLKGISKVLEKEVTVTPENCPEIILMRVKGEVIEITADHEPGDWPVRIKE